MARNLYGQMTYAINKNFKEHIDKKAFKEDNGNAMSNKIFSYSEKIRLKQIAKSFQIYSKKNNFNLKMVRDIKAEHVQKFLETAKENDCTQNTIASYANSFFKLEKVIDSTFGIKVNWRKEIVVPQTERKTSNSRGVNSIISRADYNKILEYAIDNESQSGLVLQMQNFLGVRVEEIPRLKRENINIDRKEIKFINTKGGKKLTRSIPANKVEFIKSILDKNFHQDKLFSIDGKSINRYLNRVQDNFGLERHSNHDIRRLIAQEKYNSFREEGMSIKEAANETSKWLSHGDDRQDMLERSYVKLK